MQNCSKRIIQVMFCLWLLTCQNCNSISAAEQITDWRTIYKAMAGSYYTGDYDGAFKNAESLLNSALLLTDQTEKTVALDELIKYLNMLGPRNRPQDNYAQQEAILKLKLKAYQARYENTPGNQYQLEQVRKELVTCLVLEGKSKEAQKYLSKEDTTTKSNLTGWKKDVELLTQENSTGQGAASSRFCEYAEAAVNSALALTNPTEKEIACELITQQLSQSTHKYGYTKDYARQEKILKLLLKMQEQPTPSDTALGLGFPYAKMSTLKQLVTCLVMQGKNEEAANYNKTYHELVEKMTQERKKTLQNLTANMSTQTSETVSPDKIKGSVTRE